MIRYSAEWWKVYYQEHYQEHRECLRAYHRKYDSKQYKLHPERERARRQRRALANTEKVKAHKFVRQAFPILA